MGDVTEEVTVSKPTEARCFARTQRGRCQVTGGLKLDSQGRIACPWHNDTMKGRASAMRRKGGRVSQKVQHARRTAIPPPPKTLDDAVQLASWLTHAVLQGHVTPKAAQEATRALTQFTRGLKERDVERQVRELQAQVKALKKDHPPPGR